MIDARTGAITDIFSRLLNEIDPDPSREGIRETPERAAKAWQFICGGYEIEPAELLKTFEDGAAGYDQMVVVAGIPLYSRCEHHLELIWGRATVAYIPDKRVVGLSKFSRVVDAFARRLQVQERLTTQIADCIWDTLEPIGVGVHIAARHACMEARGVQKSGTVTHTTALRGAIRESDAARAEFLSYIDRDVLL